MTDPVFEYANDAGTCSITGGYVAHDNGAPEIEGRYLYADLCAGVIRSFVPGLPAAADDRSEGVNVAQPTSFGQDSCGRLYVASRSGPVSRIAGSGTTVCPPPSPPTPPGGDPDPPGGGQPVASEISLRASKRRVREGRPGDEVALLEKGQVVDRKPLGLECKVRFRTRIESPTRFRATIGADETHLAARTSQLRIRLAR